MKEKFWKTKDFERKHLENRGFLKKHLEEGSDYQDYILKYPGILENFISLDEVNEAIDNYITKEHLQNFLVLPE